MMKLESYRKGRTVKVVTVSDFAGFKETEITEFALDRAGETRSSITGLSLTIYGSLAVVNIYTD